MVLVNNIPTKCQAIHGVACQRTSNWQLHVGDFQGSNSTRRVESHVMFLCWPSSLSGPKVVPSGVVANIAVSHGMSVITAALGSIPS